MAGGDQQRVVLLVNPRSGSGRAARRAPVLERRLRERGLSVETVAGRDADDGDARLADALRTPAAALVVVGGDGTVHQGLQHLVGTSTALGILPAGTGNDTARTLGLPSDPAVAADLVADELASPHGGRVIDTGVVRTSDGTERAFLAVVSTGFDSAVNERANAMTWPSGRVRYLRAILAELRVFRPVGYRMLLDEGLPGQTCVERSGMLVAVGNGPAYGGGMRVCPGARLDDGLLSTTFLAEMPTRTFLRVFPTVFTGTHVARPEVATAAATSVRIEAAGQVAYADGERVGPLPVRAWVRPASLRVLAPAPPPGPRA